MKDTCEDCQFFGKNQCAPKSTDPKREKCGDFYRLRKPRKEKVEDEEVTFSPGFTQKGVVFEQVSDNKYAVAGAEDLKPQFEAFGLNYAPLDRAPWPLAKEPVSHSTESEMWQEIRQFIYEHLFLPDENLYDVLTAWVMATWLHELWSVVPYIFFYGPVASGKTRGLEVLHRLAFRAIISSNISTAALFRACEQWKPTLILDETEIYNKAERNEIIGLLNAGYRRGQYAIRVKTTEKGEFLESFDVFGFKAMAGTEGLAHTLESRSIMIRMMKNRRKVRLHIDEEKALALRNKLLFWRLNILVNVDPNMLAETFLARVGSLELDNGRLEELFQCLLALANDGRENILKYAKKTAEMRQFEEQTSMEAAVVEALLSDSVAKENNIVLTKDVANKLNETRAEKEQFKTSSVGWIIRRLGFEPRHTRAGNGWLFDKDRIDYLRSIYLGSDTTAEKGSQGSQGSHAMDVDGMGSVKDVKDVNLFSQGSKPTLIAICHLDPIERGKCAFCGKTENLVYQAQYANGEWGNACLSCGEPMYEQFDSEHRAG